MKKALKILLIILGMITIGSAAMVYFSPYTYYQEKKYRSVDYSIEINVARDSVFNYLGNSANARNWSSFVDHITPLNAKTIKDGTVGSRRRCFKESNEVGIHWDEEILEVIPNRKRRLSCYDLQGFPISANGLQTEQIFDSISPDRMRLTFSLFFRANEPSMLDLLKMNYASYTVHEIFEANLKNIKRIIETGK